MADSVIIPHVIGTAAILMMFFMVSNFYEGYYANLSTQAYQAQLQQVADYLASNIMDIVALSRLTENDQFFVKEVKVPNFIGEKIYYIALVTAAPSYGEKEFIRIVTRIDAFNVYATSDLPWSLNPNIAIYSHQTIKNNRYNVILSNSTFSDVDLSKTAQDPYKRSWTMVVWCSKDSGALIIGLGVMDATQGP